MSTRIKDLRRKSSTQSIAKEEMMSDIKKYGYLKKLKTMKKKYFVLRAESPSGPARLEYYDSEKKWNAGVPPKRSITLKTCFNINKKVDSKQKNVIALYTRDDCFAIVTENDGELEQWLRAMLELQHGIVDVEGDATPKPTFEHVWQVSVKSKGLGSSKNISGTHRLCLTAKSLSLVKMNPHCDKQDSLEFPLMSIRRCGHSDCFFFMELGRSSVTGAGELWMQTEDTVIAQNMHEAILGAMKSSRNREELGPLPRPRSASTSENPTKPITSRHPGSSAISQTLGSNISSMSSSARERCDSMPSRSRTVSEGHQDISCSPHSRGHYASSLCQGHLLDRPHTIYGRTVSYSPPSNNPLSPSGICSSSSSLSFDELEGSLADFHHSRFSHTLPGENPVQTEPTITEEANDNEYLVMAPGEEHIAEQAVYMPMSKYDHSSMFLNLASPSEDVLSTSQSESTGDYLEMASPSVSSQPDGYMTMSAVGSLTVEMSDSSPSKQTLVTGIMSTAELPKSVDGYVPMAPVVATIPMDLPLHTVSSQSAKQEGYLDMTPLSSSLPKAVSHIPGSAYLEMSSPTSICQENQASHLHLSAVGTKEEFHLDKVKSYFSPSEDDSDDYIKPVRAYSIGSRPQLRKSHLTTHLETARVRAYSVGSQAASNSKKGLSGIESELGTMKNIDSRASVKSCSAPLLPSGVSRHRTASSRGEYEEDLMEIDYNQPSSHSRGKASSSSQESIDHSRRFPVNSGRQRSNSRSSSGTSPMSSLMELTEKPVKNTGKATVESKVQGENLAARGFQSKAGTSVESAMSAKTGSSADASGNAKSPSTSPVAEVQKSSANSGNNTFTLENDAVSKNEVLPNPSGDYVNLDFSCNPPSSATSALITPGKQSLQNNNALHLESIVKNSAMHDYINVHLGGTSSRNHPSGVLSSTVATIPTSMKSDYTVMAPVQTSGEHSPSQLSISLPTSEVASKSTSQPSHSPSLKHGGNKSPSLSSGTSSGGHTPSPSTRSPQSFLTFRKQISAPTAPVSFHADPPSPGRKSSCPITSSFSSCAVSPTSMTKPLLVSSPSVTTKFQLSDVSDHGSIPSTTEGTLDQSNSSLVSADGLSGCSQEKVTEVTYENVSIGSGSVPNSRPSSISSDRELNYASLDLAPSASDDDKAPRPSRNSKTTQQTTESYAEIDFTKSEGLRHTSGSLREGRV